MDKNLNNDNCLKENYNLSENYTDITDKIKEEIRINITSINQIRTLQRNISPINDVRSAINLFILLKIL